ncbi:hypothetical protein Taro_021314 [Colocasia esculenta]|uniref:Uncharacterized protein n=1 Tax=Colocasia esculenta TaxID=4460 RepID=A0A843V4L7_COLES|nr:hypothetical protein [Colocasia esculenta]
MLLKSFKLRNNFDFPDTNVSPELCRWSVVGTTTTTRVSPRSPGAETPRRLLCNPAKISLFCSQGGFHLSLPLGCGPASSVSSDLPSARSPMLAQGGDGTVAVAAALQPLPSYGDVTYRFRSPLLCGSCGYGLNLSSSKRNTTNIDSKYGKAIKKGIISFFSIDESRFSESKEYRFMPYFHSKHSWGLFKQRTKLLCGKCRNHIGFAYEESPCFNGLESSRPGNETVVCNKYSIKISALQPSSDASAICK